MFWIRASVVTFCRGCWQQRSIANIMTLQKKGCSHYLLNSYVGRSTRWKREARQIHVILFAARTLARYLISSYHKQCRLPRLDTIITIIYCNNGRRRRCHKHCCLRIFRQVLPLPGSTREPVRIIRWCGHVSGSIRNVSQYHYLDGFVLIIECIVTIQHI